MRTLFHRKALSGRVGVLFGQDHIWLTSNDTTPCFASRPVNGPQGWRGALDELFTLHHLERRRVCVALASGLYQQVQIDKPQVPASELAGALPWAIKDFVSEPLGQLVMDYVDLPTPPSSQARINVVTSPRARIQSIVDAVNAVAELESITTEELALAQLFPVDDTPRLLLWQPAGHELHLLVFRQGALCFSRALRGFKHLATAGSVNEDIDSLALEIQRSLDYLQGQLKLPECGSLQLALISPALGELVQRLDQTFGFNVSAMANKAILNGMDYLSPFALLQGEPS